MFILLFFVLFQLILTKEKPLATLKITDNYYIIKQFEMEIYDKYMPSDKSININASGTIAASYINSSGTVAALNINIGAINASSFYFK